MGIGIVAVGGVLVVMLGVSVHAAVTLPPDAPVRSAEGQPRAGRVRNWQPKRVALALSFGAAVVVYACILAVVGMAGWSNGRLRRP